jgi:hypothetical protein
MPQDALRHEPIAEGAPPGRVSAQHRRDASVRGHGSPWPYHQLRLCHLLSERAAGAPVPSRAARGTAIVAVRAGEPQLDCANCVGPATSMSARRSSASGDRRSRSRRRSGRPMRRRRPIRRGSDGYGNPLLPADAARVVGDPSSLHSEMQRRAWRTSSNACRSSASSRARPLGLSSPASVSGDIASAVNSLKVALAKDRMPAFSA